MLVGYIPENLPVDVAWGMQGDIIECPRCAKNWELACGLEPRPVELVKKVELIEVKEKEIEDGG